MGAAKVAERLGDSADLLPKCCGGQANHVNLELIVAGLHCTDAMSGRAKLPDDYSEIKIQLRFR